LGNQANKALKEVSKAVGKVKEMFGPIVQARKLAEQLHGQARSLEDAADIARNDIDALLEEL